MSPNLQARDQSRGPARSSMGPGRDVRDGQGRLCLPVCQAASHQPSGTVSRGLVRTDLDCRTRFGSDIHEPVGWLARDNGMGSHHCLSREREEKRSMPGLPQPCLQDMGSAVTALPRRAIGTRLPEPSPAASPAAQHPVGSPRHLILTPAIRHRSLAKRGEVP